MGGGGLILVRRQEEAGGVCPQGKRFLTFPRKNSLGNFLNGKGQVRQAQPSFVTGYYVP